MCVPSERKDLNVKAFNMTRRTNEAKSLVRHILCDSK